MTRLGALTSLRFVAALLIVVLHLHGNFAIPDGLEAWGFGTGVSFFFVLSGFILTYVYSSRRNVGKWDFIVTRFARLWPAHMAAFGLLFVLTPQKVFFHWSWSKLFAFITLTQSWIPQIALNTAFNTPAWSISTEMGFYVCFLFFLPIWRERWLPITLGTLGLVCTLIWLVNTQPFFNNPTAHFSWIYIFPLARLFEFSLGMAAAQIWLVHHDRASFGKTTGTLLEIVALGFAAYLMIHSESWANHASSIRFIGAAGSGWLQSGGFACIGFALLIYVMALERGAISKILAARPLLLLGEISFSIYLIHAPLLWALERFANRLADVPVFLQAAAFGVTLLLLSYIIWSGIELPCRRLIVQALLRKRERSSSGITPKSFLEGSRRGLISASLLLAFLAIPIVWIVNTPRRPHFISSEQAQEKITTAANDVRDINFGRRFLLRGVTIDFLRNPVALHLIWMGVGREKLEYTLLVQLLDRDRKTLWRTSLPQSEVPLKVTAGQHWENVISIPKDRFPGATHLAISLLNTNQKRLVPDRGPLDSEKRRVLIPIP